jgi:hypothetical protein
MTFGRQPVHTSKAFLGNGVACPSRKGRQIGGEIHRPQWLAHLGTLLLDKPQLCTELIAGFLTTGRVPTMVPIGRAT